MTGRPTLYAMLAEQAAATPSASLRDICDSAVDMVCCAAPDQYYAADAGPEVAELREAAWGCLRAIKRARDAARARRGLTVMQGGAA